MSIGAIVRRKETVTLLFLIPALILLFEYSTGVGTPYANALVGWATSLVIFAYVLGAVTLFRYHTTRISRRRSGSWQSVVILVSTVTILVMALVPQVGSVYNWLMNNLLTPLQMAIAANIGFYAYTIYYRACGRVKNVDTALLIAATVFGFLFNAAAVTSWFPMLGQLGAWIRDVPNEGAFRAITIGVALGLIQLFVRAILGLEKSYIGER